jgi:hypothetical protein
MPFVAGVITAEVVLIIGAVAISCLFPEIKEFKKLIKPQLDDMERQLRGLDPDPEYYAKGTLYFKIRFEGKECSKVYEFQSKDNDFYQDLFKQIENLNGQLRNSSLEDSFGFALVFYGRISSDGNYNEIRLTEKQPQDTYRSLAKKLSGEQMGLNIQLGSLKNKYLN